MAFGQPVHDGGVDDRWCCVAEVVTASGMGDGPLFGPDWLSTQPRPDSVIICGSAPSVLAEFDATLRHESGSLVICVNDAAALVAGDHLYTQHPERAADFKARSLNQGALVHTGKPLQRASLPGVDVYWPDALRNATSGGSAIWLALILGARRVTLCGIPLDGGSGYHPGITVHQDEPRVGMESGATAYVRGYQVALAAWAETLGPRKHIIRSLDGFTRDLFGTPDWAEERASADGQGVV